MPQKVSSQLGSDISASFQYAPELGVTSLNGLIFIYAYYTTDFQLSLFCSVGVALVTKWSTVLRHAGVTEVSVPSGSRS